jgi:DNA-binding Xre family transcriptional regulator
MIQQIEFIRVGPGGFRKRHSMANRRGAPPAAWDSNYSRGNFRLFPAHHPECLRDKHCEWPLWIDAGADGSRRYLWSLKGPSPLLAIGRLAEYLLRRGLGGDEYIHGIVSVNAATVKGEIRETNWERLPYPTARSSPPKFREIWRGVNDLPGRDELTGIIVELVSRPSDLEALIASELQPSDLFSLVFEAVRETEDRRGAAAARADDSIKANQAAISSESVELEPYATSERDVLFAKKFVTAEIQTLSNVFSQLGQRGCKVDVEDGVYIETPDGARIHLADALPGAEDVVVAAAHIRTDEPSARALDGLYDSGCSDLTFIAERAARRQAVVMPILHKKRWKRGRLATEAGVSKMSIFDYLNGKRATIRPENREAIAEALGLKPNDLPD